MSYIFLSKLVSKKRCFNAIAAQLCFRIYHYEGPRQSDRIEIKWITSSASVHWWSESTWREYGYHKVKKQTLIHASKEAGLETNVDKTEYMLLSPHKNAEQNHDMGMANWSLQNLA
jgi:hypothetical protein